VVGRHVAASAVYDGRWPGGRDRRRRRVGPV